jgi:hypothetical protein
MSGYEIYVGYYDPPLTDVASPLVGDDFEWPASVAVQWENKETSRCVAALMPNASYALERFLAGANGRKETAILVTRVGIGISPVVADDTRINAAMEPSDIRTHIAEGLTSADKDLAIRLQQDESATWYRLSVASHVGLGSLHPILVDDLGQPVAGVWIDTDDDLRWYLLPDSIEWQQLVDWLIGRAIPAYVPTAVYRARPMEAVGDQFLTPAELAAKEGLTELERETEKQRTALEAELATATALASAVRNALLFGQGDDLKKTVRGVLEEAGFNVEDLDETFEDTRSSDLLASMDGRYWLIEVTLPGRRRSSRSGATSSRTPSYGPHFETSRSPAVCSLSTTITVCRRAIGRGHTRTTAFFR